MCYPKHIGGVFPVIPSLSRDLYEITVKNIAKERGLSARALLFLYCRNKLCIHCIQRYRRVLHCIFNPIRIADKLNGQRIRRTRHKLKRICIYINIR